jgi:succinoglycan biosynthesis protein ExoA
MTTPLVTVLVPARDEEADLADCLAAVATQDHPHDRLEVVVVDGGSRDGTRQVAERALASMDVARTVVVTNPLGSTPTSLNAGLAAAQGSIICRVDARSLIPPDYVSRCVAVLERPEVVVVGGAQVASARPGAPVVARGIARALRNPYVTGLARYRRQRGSGPADTVYLGAFRRADLAAVAGWDERFATNQDFELNQRLSEHGVVWFEDGLDVRYRPRPTLAALWHQHRRFGRWKAAGWSEAGVRLQPRQLLLVAGPPLAAVVGMGVLRRAPLAAGAVAALGLLAVDRTSGPADHVTERAVTMAAAGVIAAGWWSGVLEQLVRRLRGERLLTTAGG